MAVSSKMHFLPQTEHWLLIKSTLQIIRLMSQGMERLTACHKFYLSPVVCMHLNPLSFVIGNADIDLLSSYLPASSPIPPVLNAGLVSAGTEMTVACEISFNLFAINLILMFINSCLTSYNSWSDGSSCARSCWFLAIPFLLDWFMLAPNLYILFLTTWFRSSKFWLAYHFIHPFCFECRTYAYWSILL